MNGMGRWNTPSGDLAPSRTILNILSSCFNLVNLPGQEG
jgi:hypothetical protein